MDHNLIRNQYMNDVISGSIQNLSDNADNLIRVFSDAVLSNTIQEVWNTFKEETKKFEALTNYLEIRESAEKQKVYYFAVMKTVLEICELLDGKIEEQELGKTYHNYKYLYPVLECLAKSHSLSQGDIAERIGISKNSLSNFFRRTNDHKLWDIQQRGRKHYYTITAKGKRAYKDQACKRMIYDDQEYERLMVHLLDFIADEMESSMPKADNVIQAINDHWGKGVSVFSSDVMKLKLRILFMKRDIGLQKRKARIRNEFRQEEGLEIQSYPWADCSEKYTMLREDQEFIGFEQDSYGFDQYGSLDDMDNMEDGYGQYE